MSPRTLARRALSTVGLLPAARAVHRRAREWTDAAFDRRLGIDTARTEPRKDFVLPTRFHDDIGYDPTSYLTIQRTLRRLEWTSSDVFFDVGCGAGRVLCVAAQRSLGRCTGVEQDPSRAARAVANADKLRNRRATIDIVRADAANVDYSSGTVFFFFNPFGEETLSMVLTRIEASLEKHPRRIQMAYVNSEHAHVFEARRWLRRYARIVVPPEGEITFWRNMLARS